MNDGSAMKTLRDCHPTDLAKSVESLLSKEIGKLDPMEFLDLLSLSDLEDRPVKLDEMLEGFVPLAKTHVGAVEAGEHWNAFLDQYTDIAHPLVPIGFRKILRRETEVRVGADRLRCVNMLEYWSMTEPSAFTLRSVESKPAGPTDGGNSLNASSGGNQTVDHADPKVRAGYLQDLCLERIQSSAAKGLADAILAAGLKKRAEQEYPDVAMTEVQQAIRTLRERGLIRLESGRWKTSNW